MYIFLHSEYFVKKSILVCELMILREKEKAKIERPPKGKQESFYRKFIGGFLKNKS
jgi:hypothetical protein